MVKGEMRLL